MKLAFNTSVTNQIYSIKVSKIKSFLRTTLSKGKLATYVIHCLQIYFRCLFIWLV